MSKLDGKSGGIKIPEAAQRSPTQTREERRYRAEEALRTITKAHEHMSDGGLMKDVRQLANQQMNHLAKVAGSAKGATTRKGK